MSNFFKQQTVVSAVFSFVFVVENFRGRNNVLGEGKSCLGEPPQSLALCPQSF